MHLLRGLSPFGPIFGKELRVAARRRRNYFLRVGYLGGLLLFLLFAFTVTHSWDFNQRSAAARAQQQQQLGFFFFAFFSMFCVGSMALIGPVLTCTAINGERQAKTLHVLLMTPITAWQIVSGKLLSRMLTALTLIGLSLPVLALVRLLGGVEIDQMFGVLALCTVIALFGASIGLLLSILLRRAFAVIILTYLIYSVVYFFAPLLVAALMPDSLRRLPWVHIVGAYNPFLAVGFLGWGQMRFLTAGWHICLIIHLIATAVLLIVSANLVRRLARHEGETISAPAPPMAPAPDPIPAPDPLLPPTPDASPVLDPGTAPTPLAPSQPPHPHPLAYQQPLPRRHPRPQPRRTRTVADNPILWRELRRPLMTRRWQRIAACFFAGGLLLLACIAAASEGNLDDRGFHAFLAICSYTLLLLLTCVIAATSIAGEKEAETWTVLLASPLSGNAIIWGKALGVARRLLWPIVAVAAHFLLFAAVGFLSIYEAIIAIAVCVMFITIWIATGVALSLACRRVTTAVIVNLGLPVLLYGVGSLLLAMVDLSLDLNGDLVEQVLWYLPYGYLAEGVGGGYRVDHMRQLVDGSEIHLSTYTLITLLVGFLHVLCAAALLALTATRFNRAVARAPQLGPLAERPPTSSVSWQMPTT